MEQQRTPEWFKKRIGKVTGSLAGAILGLNPNQTPADAMRKMVRDFHGAESEFKGNIMTQYGQDNEDNAIAEFERITGLGVEETGFNVSDQVHWLGASPDGLVGNDAVIEIKCPFSKRKSDEFDSIDNYPWYFAQVQVEMFCTNRTKAYFFQWSPFGSKLEIVNFDPEWFKAAFVVLEEFYSEFIRQRDMPVYLEDLVPVIEDEDLVKELEYWQAAVKDAEAKLKDVRQKMFDIAQGKKVKISNKLVFPVTRSGTVDYKKIVQEHCKDVNIEDYRGKPSMYMTIK